jgi:hypothetical protein
MRVWLMPAAADSVVCNVAKIIVGVGKLQTLAAAIQGRALPLTILGICFGSTKSVVQIHLLRPNIFKKMAGV